MGNPKCKDKKTKKIEEALKKKSYCLLYILWLSFSKTREKQKSFWTSKQLATTENTFFCDRKKLCKVAVQIACKVGDKNLQLTYKTPNPRSLGQNLVFFCRSFANYNFQKCLFPELIGYKYSYMYMCTIRPVATLSKCFIFGLNWIKLPIIVQN